MFLLNYSVLYTIVFKLQNQWFLWRHIRSLPVHENRETKGDEPTLNTEGTFRVPQKPRLYSTLPQLTGILQANVLDTITAGFE